MDNLKSELIKMAGEDQAARKIALESGILDQTIDIRNTARMKEIIDRFGWPTSKMVGDEASQAAWLIVQHADLDPEFQKECLSLMKICYDSDPEPTLEEHIEKLSERLKHPLI